MKKVAMFIAFQGFRDEEYTEPKKVLEAAGVKVTTVSTAKGSARGKFRVTAEVDKTIDEINPADYDALTAVQARADAVYAAHGGHAGRPMQGETPLEYRRRPCRTR